MVGGWTHVALVGCILGLFVSLLLRSSAISILASISFFYLLGVDWIYNRLLTQMGEDQALS